MDIMVSQVRKGDYIEGFGVVDSVRKFYKERAVKGASANALSQKQRVNTQDNRVYARIVAEQQEKLYDNLLDSVVLISGGTFRTFSADKFVKVFRFSKEAA